MIVTGERSASGIYGIVILTIVVGYGYIWWKGWKISDMMFATRGGLNDACSSVAKRLDNVYSSISVTERDMSLKIHRVDCKYDVVADNTTATKEEVSVLRGDMTSISLEIEDVTRTIQMMDSRINRMEVKQDEQNTGVCYLLGVDYARELEKSKSMEQIEGAAFGFPRLALEYSKVSPSRTVSLPIEALGKPLSPSTANGSPEKPVAFVPPVSGLKELYGMSDDVGVLELSSPLGSNGIRASEETNIDNSSSRLVGIFSGILTRSRSTVRSAE